MITLFSSETGVPLATIEDDTMTGLRTAAATAVACDALARKEVEVLADTAISRAGALVVEWKPQAQIEAGDLVQCAPGSFDWGDVWELSQAFDGSMSYQRQLEDIVIYKAIGIGLEDIALAGLAYRKAAQWHGW